MPVCNVVSRILPAPLVGQLTRNKLMRLNDEFLG